MKVLGHCIVSFLVFFLHQSTLSSLLLLLTKTNLSFGFISMNQIFFYIKFSWKFLIWVFLIYI